MIIRHQDIVDKNACFSQCELFRKVFGESAEVTLPNIEKARRAKFDLVWLCNMYQLGYYMEYSNKSYKKYSDETFDVRTGYFAWAIPWEEYDNVTKLAMTRHTKRRHRYALKTLRVIAELTNN